MDIDVLVLDKQGNKLSKKSIQNVDPEYLDTAMDNLDTAFQRKYKKYNLDKLEVGESKKIITKDPAAAASAVYMFGRRHDKKFKCTRLTNDKLKVERLK